MNKVRTNFWYKSNNKSGFAKSKEKRILRNWARNEACYCNVSKEFNQASSRQNNSDFFKKDIIEVIIVDSYR